MKPFAVVFIALMVIWSAIPAAEAAKVDRVVAVTTARDSLPPLVAERMNHSVAAIASQLLEGKDIAAVQAGNDGYAGLIHEVFDKVLVGYTVKQVRIQPAAETRVEVELLPWAEVIQSVQVETTVEGMPPRIENMVRQDLTGVEHVFEDALLGLPTAAADWTNGVLKQHLQAYLEQHLPEFRADFDVDPEPHTQVKLMVYPRLPVVRTVDLSMRSDTVPNSALLARRDVMQAQADEIVGVPVGFVRRHRQELEQAFAERLDDRRDFRVLRMQTKVAIEPAQRTQIMSRSDTSRYRLRLSGWLDIGRKDKVSHKNDENLLLRLHAGRMLGSKDEIFVLTDLLPEQMKWNWHFGWQHDLRGGRMIGLRYDMRQHKLIYDVSQKLAPRWLLRYEYRSADSMGEAALRYRLHDFVSLEYVLDNEQNWLRLIGNF